MSKILVSVLVHFFLAMICWYVINSLQIKSVSMMLIISVTALAFIAFVGNFIISKLDSERLFDK